MTSGHYNRLGYLMQTAGVNFGSSTLRCLLLRSTGAYTFNKDHDYVADLFTNGAIEITAAGYARQTLASVTSTLEDANDRSIVTATDIAFGALAAGQSVSGVVIYRFGTNDADSALLIYMDGIAVIRSVAPASAPKTGTITGATNANPCSIACTGHGLVTGEKVKFASVGGMTQLNGNVYTITVVDANNFTIGVDATAYGTYTSGGTFTQVIRLYVDTLEDDLLDGASLSFSGVTGLLYGSPVVGNEYIEIADASAAIPYNVTSNCANTAGFPIALGGGDFSVLLASGLVISA